MESSVTIPLSEYQQLIDTKENFNKLLNEKNPMVLRNIHRVGFRITPIDKFTIVNHDEIAKILSQELKELAKENGRLFVENVRLKERLDKKRWWRRIF